MTPENFVMKYWPTALEIEKDTGIPALAVLAQASLESGWGKYAIGNNLFGIKYRKGDYGYQEVLTTEYLDSPDLYHGKKVKSIEYIKSINKFKYKVWEYFADYKTAYDGFKAHADLLLSDRYKSALKWKHSPLRYIIAVWRCGYATDPKYPKKMADMINSVKKRIPKEQMTKIKSIPTPRIK